MKRIGMILPTVLLLLLFVSISSTSLISFVNAKTRDISHAQRKLENQLDAGNTFFALLGYFQKKYSDSAALNIAAINTFSATDTAPEWYNSTIQKMSVGTLEDTYWLQTFDQFQHSFYLPTSTMTLALQELTPGGDIEVVVRPHKVFPNMLLATIRVTRSGFAESIFWGFISPRYFSNWAVFLLNGISNAYYGPGEFVDGPSYYGGSGIGVAINVPPKTEAEKEHPASQGIGATFVGNMMNRKPRIHQLGYNGSPEKKTLWIDENNDGVKDRELLSAQQYVAWTEYGSKYYVYFGASSSKPAKIIIANQLQVDGNDLVLSEILTSETGETLEPGTDALKAEAFTKYFPWYFRSGLTYVTDDIKSSMESKFGEMKSYYQGFIDNNRVVSSQSVLDSYFNSSSIGNNSLGVFFGGAVPTSITYEGKFFDSYYYIEDVSTGNNKITVNAINKLDYGSVEVLTDVLSGQQIFARYNLSGFDTSEKYSVHEYWYIEEYEVWEKNNNGWSRKSRNNSRDVAQVVITKSSEFDSLPPWNAKSFFVTKTGQGAGSVNLLDQDLGTIDMQHAGVFICENDIKVGGGGLPQGTGHGSKLSLVDGRYSFISMAGNIKIIGDIVYNDIYSDIQQYLNKELIGTNVDLNRLVSENNANDMLNLVAIDKDIYMPYEENKNHKNIKIMSNIFAFGNNGSGSFRIEKYEDFNDMGYRHVFGTIVGKSASPTYTYGNNNKIKGFQEFNVYDDRLYSNEDLPVATPESSLLMAFGFGAR